ncbi:SPOSA6832_01483, partial [Sporobolomyces salmonicolor]
MQYQTPRQRSTSAASTPGAISTTSPPSRRRPPLALSPLSTLTASSPADSFRTYSYQASSPSHSTFTAGQSSHYLSFSAAASNAGSLATTANPAGPAKFRRGHARKKAGAPGLLQQAVRTSSPDELDLMSLEEPDEVFRLFGVRDVRKLEKRASDAAAAKVAELRTMVGERYRDLLSAADSIVRMRCAAEKLVERLDHVEAAVTSAEDAVEETPTKRGVPPKVVSRRTDSYSSNRQRTLASPPTLSLTIHLFLTLPSLVHTLLESSDFLPAARLENVSRVVHRELSSFTPERVEGDDEDEDAQQGLMDAFPIIERHWESTTALGPIIIRRASAELRVWDAEPITTAQTLAAIIMLENASLPDALNILLKARSHALSSILDGPSTSKASDAQAVIANLRQVLGLVLRTVEAAMSIFGASLTAGGGLLPHLLRELEKPSASSPNSSSVGHALCPILATLPNYSTLSRHLPPSILSFNPFLSASSAQDALPPSAASERIESWFAIEMDRVVHRIKEWIAALSSANTEGGAKTLSLVRTTIRTTLSTASPSSISHAQALQHRLDSTIEARLAEVYQARLSALVARVKPSLEALLLALPESEADLDTATFLFDMHLAFPPASQYSGGRQNGADPFEAFLSKVGKRAEGRSPLLDRGLEELEVGAKGVRDDLESWLGADGGDAQQEEQEREMRSRLWTQSVESAMRTLDGVAEAMDEVLFDARDDVDGSLFIGNFAFLLSASKTFTRDLLLGTPPSADTSILSDWQKRLSELQSRSLEAWRTRAVERAIRMVEDSMSAAAALSPWSTLWAWDGEGFPFRPPSPSQQPNCVSRAPLLPSSPSTAVLSALRSLCTSLSAVGLHRAQADPSISRSLLGAFAAKALAVGEAFAETVEKVEDERQRREVAAQAAWDLRLLRMIVERVEEGGGSKRWRQLEERFERLVRALALPPPPPPPLPDTFIKPPGFYAHLRSLHLYAQVSEDVATIGSSLDTRTLHYLQRSQSILAPLLPSIAIPPTTAATGVSRLLMLGTPPVGAEFKSLVGVVRPGPRLGLLPTKG